MKIYFVFLRMDIGWTNRKIVPQTCNVTFLPDFNILPIHLLYIFKQTIPKYASHFSITLKLNPFVFWSIFKLIQNGNFSRRIFFYYRYQMMLSAWHPNAECRPSFNDIRLKLETMLEATKSYINLSVSVSQDYYTNDNSSR